MSEPLIRDAEEGELDVVASLTVDAYAEYAVAMSPDSWSAFAQDIANVRGRLTDARVLVAERDGRIVGAVTLFEHWRGAQEGAAGMRLLAVPPEERGSGVGTALLSWCTEHARSLGKERVVLTVTQEMTVVRELTERMGFEREPDLDHELAPGVRVQGYQLRLR